MMEMNGTLALSMCNNKDAAERPYRAGSKGSQTRYFAFEGPTE